MEQKQDKSNEEQRGQLRQAGVSRSFHSIEEAEAYLRSEGIDPDEERAYGMKVIERLKAEIAAKDPIACPRCTPPTDPMCPYCNGTGGVPNCG